MARARRAESPTAKARLELPAWPAAAAEKRRIEDLKPYERNARKHSEKQLGEIVESMKRWGWTIPVLVDENDMILAGHGRVMAAKRLGAGFAVVPVVVARGWSEDQKRAYVLADNKLTLNGGWDADLLREELQALKAADFDLGLTGFGDKELGRIFGEQRPGEGDSQLGDGLVYRVVVDCRDEQHQAELLGRFEAEGLTCKALIA